MDRWASGYKRWELDEAQERYGLRFPLDLVSLLLEKRLIDGYAWNTEDPRIRKMLSWPLDMLLFDVEHDQWWPGWGEQPEGTNECRELVRDVLSASPKLIPLYGHRFLPETPAEPGNPVFSMYGLDTVYYGSDLENYFEREFGGATRIPLGSISRYIPFWSDLAKA